MKKILFIIPGLATGGTNTSLDSFYGLLKKRYRISIFAISHQPHSHQYSFEDSLLPKNAILSLFYSNYDSQKGTNKIWAFFIKNIRFLFRLCNVDCSFYYARKVVKKLEKREIFDYIVGFQEGYATEIAALFNNPNKVCWIHCDYDKWLPYHKSELSLYFKFKKIICVSEYTASTFARRYPSLEKRIFAIQNVIDEEKIIKLANCPLDDSRYKRDCFTILTVGRFARVKHFRDIPSIASELNRLGFVYKWYIIGPEDQEEFIDFKLNNKLYATEKKVIWLGSKSNPYPYFKNADLYVCVSESEACPMVFKEAQLLGLPIISSNFPSAKEFINEKEGKIVKVEEIAKTIVDLFKVKRKKKLDNVDSHSIISLNKLYSVFE